MKLYHIWLRELIIFSRPGNFVILLLEKTKWIKNMTVPVTIINKLKILKFIDALSRTSVLDIRPKCHPLYWTFILYGNTWLFIAIYFIPIIVNIKKLCLSMQNVWRMKYFQLRCDNQIICNKIIKDSKSVIYA